VLYPAATARVLRVDFETGWQRHRMQPLIAPRMIHKLVRDQWGLDAPEESVRIEILHDLADVAEQSLLRETMQLPAPGDFADLLAGHGLEPAGEHRWARTDRYTKGELTTAATLANTTATIALQLDRTKGLRSPHQSP
jgi:hypothetical protein